eukprot:m.141597 g.141597  ORF g.141597 m.141597 type:complete len:160 (-) comp41253_c0_seq1:66-545(-)
MVVDDFPTAALLNDFIPKLYQISDLGRHIHSLHIVGARDRTSLSISISALEDIALGMIHLKQLKLCRLDKQTKVCGTRALLFTVPLQFHSLSSLVLDTLPSLIMLKLKPHRTHVVVSYQERKEGDKTGLLEIVGRSSNGDNVVEVSIRNCENINSILIV